MNHNSIFDEIKTLVNEFSINGEKRLENGTWLVSPAPEIAPKAWLHIIYKPLTLSDVNFLEEKFKKKLPVDFKTFLGQSNGLSLFGNQISIWGLRKDMARVGNEAWQPFDLLQHNAPSEVPIGSPNNLIYFGSVERGTSWLFFKINNGHYSVGKTKREVYLPNLLETNFEEWLRHELRKIHYDFREKNG